MLVIALSMISNSFLGFISLFGLILVTNYINILEKEAEVDKK